MKKLLIITVIALCWACNSNKNDQENDTQSQLQGKVQIDGSSTVYPIAEAIAEEFNLNNPKVKITIGVSGTGGGFKKFIRNEIDIANASRPIKPSEDSMCKGASLEYIELPIAYDGLAVVVNPQNDWVKDITVEELKKIWEPAAQGKITKWNQVRSNWPDLELHLFGAGTQSGTFDYFTEAIVGKSKSCRGDYTASEDDNVLVQGISTDKNALGFFGLDYYSANKERLKLIAIDDQNDTNGKGPVQPSEETVKDGTYQPLSRPLFVYINKKSLERPEIDVFAKYLIKEAPGLVSEAGYVPLTTEIYGLVNKRLDKKTTGSVFLNKSSVGVKMEEILKME
jgi:phosphate transport system substrate-binding protein